MSALPTLLGMLAAVLLATPAIGQTPPPSPTERPAPVPGAAPVQVEMVEVYSRAIAGNLLGTPALRQVTVILPPSYASQPQRHYPVVYALHGFWGSAPRWLGQLHAPDTVAAAFARGVPEMILVFPTSDNVFGGSFYGSSPTTGDFETFIADELVAYIDAHYRTLARPESRGLMGHSMGGYGTARVGMKRSGRFGALYMMSACCIAPIGTQGMTADDVAAIAAMTSPDQATGRGFTIEGPLATAAAWSPNPALPPMYADLAVDAQGEPREEVLARRIANAPLAFIDQHIAELRQYRAIGIDVGDQDTLVESSTRLHEVLDSYGIANSFAVYPGTHTSGVAVRFQDYVLPFFGEHLAGPNE